MNENLTRMDFCIICLRTERFLKKPSKTLKQFHNEMCDLSIIPETSLYYCNECEYLLTKFYKFKKKCIEALKVYQKWTSMKVMKKQTANVLYTLLPLPSLGTWNNVDKMAIITVQVPDTRTLCIDATNDTKIEVKQVYNQINNNNNNSTNIIEDDIENKNIAKIILKSDKTNEVYEIDCTENEEPMLCEYLEDFSDDDSELINGNGDDCNAKSGILKDKIEIKNDCAEQEELTFNNLEELSDNDKCSETEDDVIKPRILNVKKKKNGTLLEIAKINDKKYDSIFDIEYLTTKEKQLEEFEKRKTYKCYVKAKDKCDICYQPCKNFKSLEYHISRFHTERTGTKCCPICKIWAPKLSAHRFTHNKVFKCKLCPLVTYHRGSMRNHYEWHIGKQYRCDECDVSFKSKSSYATHKRNTHGKRQNVCEGCGRGFSTPAGLQVHKSTSVRCTLPEEILEGVVCDECDVTFPSQEVYDAHILDVHTSKQMSTKKQPPPRIGAGLPSYSRTTYKKRQRGQTSFQAVNCRLCNTELRGWWHLQLHFKSKHPNDDLNAVYADKARQLCDICGASFSHVYSLRDHMTKHTGVRPFACDLCPKRFRSALLRNDHRVRHFPSTYSCSYCGKQFKSNGNLYTHMKIHIGVKDQICDICGKGFIHRYQLTEHIEGVHYNIRRKKKTTDEGKVKRRKTLPKSDDDDCGDHSE